MTRSDLIDRLSLRFPTLQRADAAVSVAEILTAIKQHLGKGCRVEVRGFGTFQMTPRPARRGRNPKTGELVSVPPKRRAHFRPGKELRDRLQPSGPDRR